MKICGISDIHGDLIPADQFEPCDVICICGDIMPLNIQRDNIESIVWFITDFYKWVESLPCEKVIMIWGNHDFIGEYLSYNRNGDIRTPSRVLKKLKAPSKLILLQDSLFYYKGIKFWGSPWCPNLSSWAFYKDHDDLLEVFNNIPNNIDVLLTHTPPSIDTYGTVTQPGFNYMTDYGCHELTEVVLKKKPKIHIFGHVHSGRHISKDIDGTTYCNISIKDEHYDPIYEPTYLTL